MDGVGRWPFRLPLTASAWTTRWKGVWPLDHRPGADRSAVRAWGVGTGGTDVVIAVRSGHPRRAGVAGGGKGRHEDRAGQEFDPTGRWAWPFWQGAERWCAQRCMGVVHRDTSAFLALKKRLWKNDIEEPLTWKPAHHQRSGSAGRVCPSRRRQVATPNPIRS